MSDAYASVAVPVPVRRLFTYRVDPQHREQVAPGVRVRVPFGRRRVEGTVVEGAVDAPGAGVTIRAIESVLASGPRLPPPLLELTRFVSDYYLCSWGEAIEAALPPAAGAPPPRRAVRRLPGADPSRLSSRATARRRLLELLPADGTPLRFDRLDAAARRAVRPLASIGWLEIVTVRGERPERSAGRPLERGETPPEPTERQAAVLERLRQPLAQGGFSPFVLLGATGSGKTEVYLRAAERTLARGRGVLYLVPEIGLTPLLVAKISRRFPGKVAVLHSGRSARERYEEWERVREGSRPFVVGARSAVFAPLEKIGLIVVDEEQDGSYKQAETPRYNGRDLAVVRARAEGATVLLGSATPSMESFQHARAGRYGLLRLGGRIGSRPLAAVERIDMRREFESRGRVSPLSRRLIEGLESCLARGEQALVLRNRRGWAPTLLCPKCGTRVSCSRCSVSLTWHRHDGRLRCHYCGEQRRYPERCEICGGDDLHQLGEGTERLEEELRRALPGARIERMDRDTIRRRGAHEALLTRFDAGEIDLLVGTQMIAKGHDFPRVTLVGVLSADQALGLPDFRAGERGFQLLTQVAGRAGRGEREGRVLVQAFEPDHPVLRLAAAQDYESFFEREIVYRRALRYPPVSAMVEILVQDRDELRAREWAALIADAVREQGGSRLTISGPGPAPVERIKGRYRQQILARSAGRRRLVTAVDRAMLSVEGEVPQRAVVVDVDPQSLL